MRLRGDWTPPNYSLFDTMSSDQNPGLLSYIGVEKLPGYPATNRDYNRPL